MPCSQTWVTRTFTLFWAQATAQAPCGAPSRAGPQVPSSCPDCLAAAEQAEQALAASRPPQAVAQQTPSMQKVESHSPPPWQG